MPDRIEAGTYMVAAAITGGELEILDCPFEALDAVSYKLREMGVWLQEEDGYVLVRRANGLVKNVDVTTLPHPGFPTDMQAQLMALMCFGQGAGTIEEKSSRIASCTFSNSSGSVRTCVSRGVPPWFTALAS